MKFIASLILTLITASSFSQDVSFSKPGKNIYAELQNPARADMETWSKLKRNVYVSFADDNIRYQKEKVPAQLNQNLWNAVAWKGEKIHTQLLVWTKIDIPELSISVSDLIDSKGDRISAVNIKPGFVRYVMTDEFGSGCDTRKTTDYDSSLVEDPIDIVKIIPVKVNSVQPVWISIQVPGDIPAGQYKGTLTVNASGKFTMNIILNVLDHLLPPPGKWKYDLDLWQSAASIAKVHDVGLWSDEHFNLMRPYFTLLAGAGQKAITANIIDQPWGKGHVYHDDPTLISWTKKKDGNWAYDYMLFDRYISTLMECGIDQRINCYTMVTWDLSFIYFDESLGRVDTVKNAKPGSKSYTDFWTPMIKDFTGHLKDKGWFGKTAVAMDERDMESMKAVISLLRSIDPQWKVALAGDYHPEIVNEIFDYCLNIGQTFTKTELEKRKGLGEPSTFYNACGTDIPNAFTYSSPAENVWISWYAAAAGFTGYLRWAYNNWNREPLLDSRFRTWPGGDLYQIYPGPRSSIRFEKFIEGIQDFEKIRILREQFADGNKSVQMKELDNLLSGFTLERLKNIPAAGQVAEAKKKLNSYAAPPGDYKLLIFPFPRDIKVFDGEFELDSNTFILIPQKASKQDNFLARLISNEFADKYEIPVMINRKLSLNSTDKCILIGDLTNPLVKTYCDQQGLTGELKALGNEGYIISVTSKNIVVAGNNGKGALFGLESLRQLITVSNGRLSVQKVMVKDAPKYPFRGIKLYLPGRENITFFKRFVSDFVAYYKFNTIILELNANMRLEKHPELNTGAVKFKRMLDFSRLDRPPGQHMEYQNSSHQDNADGGILEKEEVADLVSYMRQFNIEVIPELPSLTHAYYLLAGHEDLAENLNQPVPDTYCPLKPESYKLYFDVLDEYIEVIHPSIIHIGHDEWRMEKDLCELCKGKDYGELYATDVTKIHDYLAKKGIKTALWGDHLLESVTEKEFQTWKSSAGYQYKIPGALRPEQVIKLIPKDILVFNWFWDEPANDKQVSDFGFSQVYGNLRADIEKWDQRSEIKGLMGGAPSSWAATTEFNIGKDQLVDFLGCSNLLWSKQYVPVDMLAIITDALVSDINFRFSGKKLPSEAGTNVIPVDISPYFNSNLDLGTDSLNPESIITGRVKSGSRFFEIKGPSPDNLRAVVASTGKDNPTNDPIPGIKINQDVNSILFLHACTKEGSNQKAYAAIYDFFDTSELLGWYEVKYEDGLIITVPVRYGVNILDWRWKQRIASFKKPMVKYNQNQYAYDAPSVLCSVENSGPVTFFAFEWENPRFGQAITEINLKSANYGKNNENAIILLAISITENSRKVGSKGKERQ